MSVNPSSPQGPRHLARTTRRIVANALKRTKVILQSVEAGVNALFDHRSPGAGPQVAAELACQPEASFTDIGVRQAAIYAAFARRRPGQEGWLTR